MVGTSQLTRLVPAVRTVLAEARQLHPQLGAGAGPHPAAPVQGGEGGVGAVQVLVLGDRGQELVTGLVTLGTDYQCK